MKKTRKHTRTHKSSVLVNHSFITISPNRQTPNVFCKEHNNGAYKHYIIISPKTGKFLRGQTLR